MDVALQFKLAKGKILSRAELDRLQAQEDLMQLKQAAYHYVSYKPRTAEQVRRAMLKKNYTAEEADYAVNFLYELDYLDDKEYARMFIRDTLARKAFSTERLKTELRKRGIAKFDIEDVLAETFANESAADTNLTSARAVAEKKLRSLARKDPEKRKQALVGYLQRQGFGWDVIRIVVEEVLEEVLQNKAESSNNENDTSNDE